MDVPRPRTMEFCASEVCVGDHNFLFFTHYDGGGGPGGGGGGGGGGAPIRGGGAWNKHKLT